MQACIPCSLFDELRGGVLGANEGLVRRAGTPPLGVVALGVLLVVRQADEVLAEPKVNDLFYL